MAAIILAIFVLTLGILIVRDMQRERRYMEKRRIEYLEEAKKRERGNGEEE